MVTQVQELAPEPSDEELSVEESDISEDSETEATEEGGESSEEEDSDEDDPHPFQDARKANILLVKQTLADGNLIGEKQTIDDMFSEEQKGKAFITMTEGYQYLYDVDENSDYYVAMIDTMRRDENTKVTDVTFARTNVNGEVIDGAYYDYETGICYIPKSACKNENGDEKLLEVQAQVLQVANSSTPETAVDIVVNNENVPVDVSDEQLVVSDATELVTAVKLSDSQEELSKINADDITVTVNGDEEPIENCVYDSTSGELYIPIAPASLDTVEITLEKENPIVALFTPMKVHATSADELPSVGGAWNIGGTAKAGDIMTARCIASYTDEATPNNEVYGSAGANSSDAVLEAMANAIYNNNGSIDLSNLEKLNGLSDDVYPWHVSVNGITFTAADGTTYTGGEAMYALKCGHITNPYDGYAAVGANDSQEADIVLHIYKVNEQDNWMIIGLLTPASHTQTGVGIFKVPITPSKGKVKLKKSSANTSISDNNDCYSLKGAEYGVYSDSECKNSVGTLTTDSNGESAELELTAGTYYVKETKAPKGFYLNATVHTVTVTAGQTATVTDSDMPGNDPIAVMLQKKDLYTGELSQGDGSLQGAQYTVKYYDTVSKTDPALSGKKPKYTWVLATDKDGFIMLNDNYKISGPSLRKSGTAYVLPLGTLTIQESKAPTGYRLNNEMIVVNTTMANNVVRTTNLPTDDTAAKEQPQMGGVKIQKYDSEWKTANPQGDGSLEGAQFAIINQSAHPVYVDGKKYDVGQTVKVITTDSSGYAATGSEDLPYGTYKITEVKAPTGYKNEGVISQTFTIRQDKQMVDLTAVEKGIQNDVIRGGVKIQKYDFEWKNTNPQGDATLEGAQFAIINRSTHPVYVNGKSYDVGATVKVITTNSSGYATTGSEELPYGTYEITEIKAPTGYRNKGIISQRFTIRQDKQIVDLTALDKGIQNNVIRGGLKVQKRDLETEDDSPIGGANFSGITMEIVNVSTHAVRVEGKDYNPGNVVKTFVTNKNGTWTSAKDLLPYGTYILQEAKVPAETGYLKQGILSKTFKIREDGVLVDLGVDSDESAIQNQVMRGDFEIRKIDSTSQRKMANIQFRITSMTNGESHVFMTDDNGEYRSSSSWIQHSQNTNNGTNGRKNTGDGLWFGTTSNGVEAPVNDSLGALPYDTYLIEELPCEANKNKVLFTDTISIYTDQQVVYLNNIENLNKPSLVSQASGNLSDVTLGQYILADDEAVITDVVQYTGVTTDYLTKTGASKKYTYIMIGKLMDKETGEPILINDEEVVATKKFKSELSSGSIRQQFAFDASELDGKTLVVFEYMYAIPQDGTEDDKILVASHEDLEDEDQTIYVPGCGTTAIDDDTKEQIANISETIHITDTVEYQNLIVGFKYTVKGSLIDKESGKPVLDKDGNEVTASTTFKATESDGTVDVNFEFEAPETYAGHDFVVFESIYHKDALYAVHADIEDEGQTIHIPEIGTTATDDTTEDHVGALAEKTTVADQVEYHNLIEGKTYTVTGTLVIKETGESLKDADGNLVTAEQTFVADEKDGTVELNFTFDSGLVAGKTVVAFEDVKYEGVTVAIHADIDDEDQSVHFPDVETTAVDKETKSHIGTANKKAVIIDTVAYKNLIPGKEYRVSGILMNQKTKKPLLIDEKEVTAEKIFTPKEADGTVELKYEFDASKLAGASVVVFEDIYYDDILLTSHADVEDREQTVSYPKIGTTASINDGKEAVAEGELTVVDQVAYENLIPGEEYTLEGILMDKATGKPLRIHGAKVTSNCKFTPDKAKGTINMTFTFSADGLGKKEIVVFEELYADKSLVTSHKDIEDEGQTVKLSAPSVKKPPKTGDSSSKWPFAAGCGVLGSIAVWFFIRKKRRVS
ncbi:MAG: VaFE repeat-containing surface-anchored protein [Lachnospiraceae bacterium]|nr:VaFE repeat-containing surface-anchored protein [Lachnospiraceae bacterium]